ncbi:interleukin-17 receptor C [Odontesthes bonariensis]|uniref:interleukin-17 receptor C isoform X1 n=1 Tax=Odontesthes bonariensis TaxID=219752 RepID=UPI003F58A423
MSLSYQRGLHAVPLLLSLLCRLLFFSAGALEIFDQDTSELVCSEGFTDCHVSSAQFTAALSDPYGSVDVTRVQLSVVLCRSAPQDFKPCLQINITLQDVGSAKTDSEESGDDSDEEALVKVCLSYPGIIDICKAVHFKPGNPSSNQTSNQSSHKLLLTEQVDFGITVVVVTDSKETHDVQNITIPALEEVCSTKIGRNVKECAVPRLQAVTEHERNVVRLQLENTDSKQEELFLQMVWNEIPRKVLPWPKGKREILISLDFVAPCLCFQVWWKGSDRRGNYCPFTDQQDALERMRHNVSVSLVESRMRDGGTGLKWNATSPCRLEAEVWLCKKDMAGGQCEEVTGSRQNLQARWIATHNGHWQTGEFNVSSHPLLCVQMKIKGMESYLEPHCPFARSRVRWILPLLIGLPLMCLAVFGAYFIQGVLKGYVWRWLKEDDVKVALGGGHVVLLYPPDDDDQHLPELLCHLGSSLQALGFTVSLDLWSQAELGMLGPVPWLHSRLDQLQRQGGKVVLVLTQATWTRAEEWGAQSCERYAPREKNRDVEEDKGTGGSCPASSRHLDVFGASLSCILADYLQGRAGERFMLVQFESLPPEPPGSFRPLPQLFRGLHVYSLPSQSLGFLTELAGAKQMASASARRKRTGGLRMASRTLAQRLSGFTAGTNVLRLAGVSQGCVGVGVEDSGETVPLQPCLLTPPSSPDTDPKDSEMEWV